ncbi:glycine cleavage system aminomethyltransferase GcvT [Sulfitobacter mediterraneus]|uniref:glycine cleavage system aminomethyltransferase GcvT n=1 Tax=Sulfitobacter mediterraneus TaxID=83219 RepID=UPI0019343FF0|nr:glycine cleavage system aminomethyltransferase GcvT [Sulfitobacter mediterraneus]MBM1311226.1 glycine cleavage system aminomethyltransferase GcvT [Sulfitobacter mediterraneus]MBM1315108.1 glycine cleavage system aminomethyltransferase GcvT [Sulfitobacter mediterraneus]MBM1323469.1 glycine cleavage system aminomethyltransferase GcvT [Sulfitobacter mediterraneus]MBM1327381.1 glycine cleavage system aminomethyltransferase GcvT [Sulfitobacter mediterraneus]MBM1398729.1 glycine cleavage system a
MSDLNRTPLFDLHVELGAKMVPFAGYEMPVQYPLGVMKEHQHTREAAGLFDVSHMGQVILSGQSWEAVATAFETLVPMDVLGLGDGRQRYGLFTNDAGGIEDDLMFARRGDDLFVVVNAACKTADIARMKAALEPEITVTALTDRALIAVQGPGAEAAVSAMDAAAADMTFMDVRDLTLDGIAVWASRSGYTGEDGYEISVPDAQAEALTRKLLAQDGVEAIGLGARDSLRLEAGLCLYGHDIDATTNPVEGALNWTVQKIRRAGGDRAGGFPGAEAVMAAFENGAARKRVGLLPEGRAPMREGVAIFDAAEGGTQVGTVTSGGFGPTFGGPVAMGYVATEHSKTGTPLWGEVRGKRLPLTIAKLPFVAANFKR